MKELGVLISILIIIGCALGIGYQIHPEAFQDAAADFKQDPDGIRYQLGEARKESQDLKDANATLTANTKNLTDEVAQLRDQLKAALTPPLPTPGPAPVTKTFVPPFPIPQQANWTWTTTDNKTYKNVRITKVEADCVTIIHDEGGARIYIVTLPPEIQKMLNFDPDLAKIAGEARVKEDIDNKILLAAEKGREQTHLRSQGATDQSASNGITDGDRQMMSAQISQLRADITQKLRELARNAASDGYDRTQSSSHSAYQDAISREAQQMNDLQVKSGVQPTPLPVYYPYYPYYYYYLP